MRIIISPRRVKKQNRIEQTKQKLLGASHFLGKRYLKISTFYGPFVQNYELMCVPSLRPK